MSGIKKRARRLTRLKISEVSAVPSGAGRGVQVVLMKADTQDGDVSVGEYMRQRGQKKRPRFRFGPAFNLVPVDQVEKVDTQHGGHAPGRDLPDDDFAAASLQRALAEIEEGRQFSKTAGVTSPTVEDNMDIITKMASRVAEIRKADPSIRSDEVAMLRLAEDYRNPDAQALWKAFKEGTAPASAAIEKSVKIEKTLRKVDKRIAEIRAANPGMSRESAIAKIATTDLDLWSRYRVAAQSQPAA
jgi:hypothetical protein